MATEEEEMLEKLGAVKSSYKLISLAKEQLESRLLNEDEELNNSPSSFTNIFLENYGRITANSFYEQMMYKNEMTPSTAINLKSLLNKINSSQLGDIFATPAEMTFVLGYVYDDLVAKAKSVGNQIVINKDCIFKMLGQENFILDHNIIVKVTNPGSKNENVYAYFDTSDKLNPQTTLSKVNNIFINTQILKIDDKLVFSMFLPTRQMTRDTIVKDIITENPDFIIDFDDQLYGFEVHYQPSGEDSWVYINGLPDGNVSSSGYNYALDLDDKKIYISFNRHPDYWKPAVGDKIEIVVYTTKGSAGNFTIPDIYTQYNDTLFSYSQDRNDPQQDVITEIHPYLTIKDSGASGGKDMRTFEEIRSIAIARGSNISVLSPGDLENKALDLGFVVKKIRHDTRCLDYRASGILTFDKDIISSIMTNLNFDLSDIPINTETMNRTLSPKNIYQYKSQEINYLKDPNTYQEYYEEYITKSNTQYMFPFHIRFKNNTVLETSVFNMNIKKKIYNLTFEYFNQYTANESSIINFILNRDPIRENPKILLNSTSDRYTTGYYELNFVITTSANVVENLYSNPSTPIMKYKVVITTKEEKKFLLESFYDQSDIDLENNTITLHAYIKTDDAIDDNDRIIARDYCMQPIPFIQNPIEYYLLTREVSVTIYAIEKELNGHSVTTGYDEILTDKEKNDLYFVSTVYNCDNVELFEDYSDYLNFTVSLIINQAEYQRYKNTVYKTYEFDEYLTDENGNFVTEEKTTEINGVSVTIEVNKILHKKGSIVYKEPNEMLENELYPIVMKLTGKTAEQVNADYNLSQMAAMVKLETAKMTDEEIINYSNIFLNISISQVTENIKNRLQTALDEYRVPFVLHKAGDIINEFSLAKDKGYTAQIKNVPVFDRIYSLGTGYDQIITSYETLISNIKTLKSKSVGELTLSLGIQNTAGPGEYEVYNQTTNRWSSIDDIALSFEIGVKFSDGTDNDPDADSLVIADTIRDYINNYTGISFSINSIFDEVKQAVPSVDYMILYSINNYQPNEVQAIRKKDGVQSVADKMSVKQIVDTINSDIESETITFKPDIDIRIIQ